MNNIKYDDLQIEKLSKAIEEVRSVLNEICSTSDEENSEVKLNVSRFLDELIVEYLRRVYMKNQSAG